MWIFWNSRREMISGMVNIMKIKTIVVKKDKRIRNLKKGRFATSIAKGDNMVLNGDFISDNDEE